ncbi:MAG: methyl-accepting chemotaxis protein [Chloroflexia bacterium]|nr:methyl-accepting chemotaxis protein [Chloroflexia bacterium]
MGTWLRDLFTAPTFADEDKTRAARLLHTTLIVFTAIAGALSLLLLFLYGWPDNGDEAFTVLSGLLMTALSVWFLFLARRGHTRLAAFLLILLLWGVISAWSVLFSGLSGENSMLIYPFLIALAGLLIGEGAAIGVTGLAVLGVLAAYTAEVTGFVVPTAPQADVVDLIMAIPILLLTGLLLRHAVRSNRQGFTQTRQREQELRESNQLLDKTRTVLAERAEQLQGVVQACVACMDKVAQGNLAARVEVAQSDGDDPLAILGQRLNETIASLQRMTARLRHTAGNLASAAAEILTTASQQASGAMEQSAAIQQASTTIEQVRAVAERSTQRAQQVAGMARRTADVSQGGLQAVSEATAGIQDVRTRVETIEQTVRALSEQAQAIERIISTVNEIAAQSNMLALNAAVEAARAGAAGRGFAVVAEEVRSLAEQSQQATEQVQQILLDIQGGIGTAVLATEEGMEGADLGVRLAGEAGRTIEDLAESVVNSTESAAQIVVAAEQQLNGMDLLAQAMQSMQQVTKQTLDSAGQSERSAGELHRLAGELGQLVEQYRLD